jgi:SAM-dependent methyltransferase
VAMRMYTEFARYCWLINPAEDYAKEAVVWREALRSKLGPGRHTILELGVGGGCNLSHLTDEFDAVAADISPEMIEQAKKLNPGVEFHVGDMRTIRLGRTFKAVLIHDAITYMQTEDDLRAVFATAAAHLEPGGVFLTSPDYVREVFKSPTASVNTRRDATTTFTYVEYTYDPDPADTTVETLFRYFIHESGTLRIEDDPYVLGLFPTETWLKLLREAGFEAETLPYDVEGAHGAPLFRGVLKQAAGPS